MAISYSDIKRLVGRDNPVMLEIGSNDGTDTLEILRQFPAGRIHCFEPDPRAARRWRENVTDPRATLHEFALGASNGRASFHQSGGDKAGAAEEGWDYSGSLRAPKEHLIAHPDVTFDTLIDIEVKSLDSWSTEANVEVIDFIWADVQGAEGDLIMGGGATLARTRYFYTEYDRREMYEGQWRLDKIAEALPNHEIVRKWRKDVLFALKSEGAQL